MTNTKQKKYSLGNIAGKKEAVVNQNPTSQDASEEAHQVLEDPHNEIEDDEYEEYEPVQEELTDLPAQGADEPSEIEEEVIQELNEQDESEEIEPVKQPERELPPFLNDKVLRQTGLKPDNRPSGPARSSQDILKDIQNQQAGETTASKEAEVEKWLKENGLTAVRKEEAALELQQPVEKEPLYAFEFFKFIFAHIVRFFAHQKKHSKEAVATGLKKGSNAGDSAVAFVLLTPTWILMIGATVIGFLGSVRVSMFGNYIISMIVVGTFAASWWFGFSLLFSGITAVAIGLFLNAARSAWQAK